MRGRSIGNGFLNIQTDQRSVASSQQFLMNLQSAPASGTNKDYLKNMLIQKFIKKYSNGDSSDSQTIHIINAEIFNFMKTEKLNKENIKILESKIEEKLIYSKSGGNHNRISSTSQSNTFKVNGKGNSFF